MLAAALAFLAAVRELYVLQMLSFVFIFAIYAQSWNLVAHSGQHSLGHAAFLGLGSYGSIVVATRLGVPSAVALFLGPLVSALAGLGIGGLCPRPRAADFRLGALRCPAGGPGPLVAQFCRRAPPPPTRPPATSRPASSGSRTRSGRCSTPSPAASGRPRGRSSAPSSCASSGSGRSGAWAGSTA